MDAGTKKRGPDGGETLGGSIVWEHEKSKDWEEAAIIHLIGGLHVIILLQRS